MSDDWQVGDLALCVDDQPRPTSAPGMKLERGRIYRVVGVGRSPRGATNLFMEGIRYRFGLGSAADRYRKIRPDEPTACEEEFRILLQLSKKRVKA